MKKKSQVVLIVSLGLLLGCKEEQYTVNDLGEYVTAPSIWEGNGDFNNGLWGWTLVTSQVRLDNDTIAGLSTAIDLTLPEDNNDQNIADNTTTLTITSSLLQNDGYGYSANLTAGGIKTKSSNDVFHGPYMYSDYVAYLQAGDLIEFEWQAQAYGDSFDVFGYIVDINDNYTETILDNTSEFSNSSQLWKTETHQVVRDGDYLFVFVNGSYDRTGGREVGAKLYLDDIKIIRN